MNKKTKILPTNKLFTLFVVLFILGGFFIITSGILYEPAARFTGSSQSTQNLSTSNGFKSPEILNLEEQVKNNPGDYNKLLNLAHHLGDNGHYLDAIKRYDQYLEKYPNSADVIVDKGVCYYNMKDYKNADEVMKSALKINPKHEIAHLNLGIVNMAAGKKNEAINWWNKLITINPNSDFAKRAKELINSH